LNEPTLNQQSNQILQILSGKRTDPIKPLIKMESWKKKFSTWRESTTTLPSRLHLGHYKALLTTYYLETDTKFYVNQDLKKIQEKLLEACLTIVNMAIKTQTSLTRWKKADNIIIPKKKNARSLKYFRNIHIFKADWNAIIGIKWKEALKKSEDSNMLQLNQFGSRN
jgi:hypothetical protein